MILQQNARLVQAWAVMVAMRCDAGARLASSFGKLLLCCRIPWQCSIVFVAVLGEENAERQYRLRQCLWNFEFADPTTSGGAVGVVEQVGGGLELCGWIRVSSLDWLLGFWRKLGKCEKPLHFPSVFRPAALVS